MAPDEDAIALRQSALTSNTLEQYAAKCDIEIGVTVPDFDCDLGTLVPTTHASGTYPNMTCDQPNRLNHECDPGSKFQVLANTSDAYVVAHCRKKGNGAGKWGDIAVIQHNKKNGATCFYQSFVRSGLDGSVKAPSKGTSAWSWHTPASTASIGCAGCHDNGPLIRSPYLSQITGPNQLPGAHDSSFNRDGQPYRFIGDDFANWKVYKVEVAGNICNGCHRMAVNNVRALGTSLDLGLRATAKQEDQKNPHSDDSPIWMTPDAITFKQSNADAAEAIRKCAQAFRDGASLPTGCKVTEFTTPAGSTEPRIGEIWHYTGTPCSGDLCSGWTKLDNNPRSIDIEASGANLYQLHVNGEIWRSTGAVCSRDSCPGWTKLDNNPKAVGIKADGAYLYQLHNDGGIWQFIGTACVGDSCPGWQRLDRNTKAVSIAAASGNLYQLHVDGTIWKYTGTPCAGDSCLGWQRLGNNPKAIAIVADGANLYQLHVDGAIWKYTGTPCSGDSCPGWQMLDTNAKTSSIAAGNGGLYQLHVDGGIWAYTGTACTGHWCPGWQKLDNSPRATAIFVAGNGQLYQ